jgi:thymidylate kinase
MWISLEGIDGAGKSTLARGLTGRFSNLRLLPRREISPATPYVDAAGRRLAQVMWEIGDSRDLSSTFWLYLQGAWHVLAYEGQAKDQSCHYITDGWFYKFLARLAQQDYDLTMLFHVLQLVPKPDHVVLLDVSPESAWQRKTFRPTELGLHKQSSEPSMEDREAFIEYQRATYHHLLAIAEKNAWTIIPMQDGDSEVDSLNRVATALCAILE